MERYERSKILSDGEEEEEDKEDTDRLSESYSAFLDKYEKDDQLQTPIKSQQSHTDI